VNDPEPLRPVWDAASEALNRAAGLYADAIEAMDFDLANQMAALVFGVYEAAIQADEALA
jgi:hypothetical protein